MSDEIDAAVEEVGIARRLREQVPLVLPDDYWRVLASAIRAELAAAEQRGFEHGCEVEADAQRQAQEHAG